MCPNKYGSVLSITLAREDLSGKTHAAMAEMMALLKPAPFQIKKEGDPEHLLQEFLDYVEIFKSFLAATGADGAHTEGHVAEAGGGTCKGCNKSKEMLKLVAGKEMTNLFKHTGLVEDGDSFDQALDKIEQGIKKQTNQASARFKLFQQMPQSGRPMSKWFPEIKEQADRCDWTSYGSKEAARDSILFQCDDKKLMRKIMAEDLNFDDTVTIALAMEQGSKKVEEIRGKGLRKEDEKLAR